MVCRRESKGNRNREKESEQARKRYAEDPEYRARKLATNGTYRRKNRKQIAARERENVAARREADRKRYAEDPEYRARKLASNMAYYWRQCGELNAQRREKRSADPEFRERLLERQNERRHMLVYGLSREDYQRMLIAQNGACAICHRKSKRRLCVDHCHITGEVRGLLCHNCNTALGLLDDDPKRMLAAGRYVLRARRVAQARARCAPGIFMTGASSEQRPVPGVHACVSLPAQVGRFGFAGSAVFSAIRGSRRKRAHRRGAMLASPPLVPA